MDTFTVTSFDGTTIRATDSGGDGPVVVLLHGATMTFRTNFATRYSRGESGWLASSEGRTIASRLIDAGARIVGVDARGHGGSGRSTDPERYRGDAHANDAMRVIDALAVDVVDVVGYSMGAITACRLLGLEPRLRSVVLGGTGPLHVEGFDDELWERLASAGRCLLENDFAEHPEMKMYRAFARLDPESDTASIGAALIGLEPAPIDRLGDNRATVTVLNGNDDFPEDTDAMAALIPGATGRAAGDGDHATSPSNDRYQDAVVEALAAHW